MAMHLVFSYLIPNKIKPFFMNIFIWDDHMEKEMSKHFFLPKDITCKALLTSHIISCFWQALAIIDEVGDILSLKYSNMPVPALNEKDPYFRQRYNLDGAIDGEDLDKPQ